MRKKRVMAMMLATSMCLSMAACGEKEPITETSTTEEETTAEATEESMVGKNLLTNGDFSNDLSHWSIYTNGGSASQNVNANGQMQIDVRNVGTVAHGVQPYYDGFALDTGCVYEFSFEVSSTMERSLEWRLQMNGGDYHAYVSDIITVGEEMQKVTATFTMEEGSDPAPRLCINMGAVDEGSEGLAEHTVYFDNFELILKDDSGIVIDDTELPTANVQVNQVGYYNDAVKQAVVRGDQEITGGFTLVDAETKEEVYSGELSSKGSNLASKEFTAIADFSEFKESGTYMVVTENYGESFVFTIDENPYEELQQAAFRMFYLQRCGESVVDEVYGHDACHTGIAQVYEQDSKTAEVFGGWHDAGDYGRYTVAGAKAAVDLMLLYENYGDVYGDHTGIPESGNGVSDLLDEVKVELDWMLAMQDASSGGVYHKITCENFPESVMPEEETEQLYLAPISTTATGTFVATMAMAARVYKDVDPAYSQTCLDAALKAWSYLEATENDGLGFKNPGRMVTGEYGDGKDGDERFFALAELYKTTGDEQYAEAMESFSPNGIGGGLGWQSVGLYGMYSYLTSAEAETSFYAGIKERFYLAVNTAAENAKKDAYQVALANTEYGWGSNMSVANNGMLLLMANSLEENDEYVQLAARQLDYLLGTNTNSYCFVTGFGTLSPVAPHHRPSEAKEAPMPGMLVGGPDANLEDPYAKAVLVNVPAAACYVDNVQSYSCNEVTIYWNSPFVYLINAIENELN